MGDDDLRGRFRRDFTQEPIGSRRPQPTPPVSPATAIPEQHVPPVTPAPLTYPIIEERPARKHRAKKPKRRKRKLFIVLFILLIMAIGGAAGYEYIYMRPQVPANITSQAEIPILYPEKLPTGFRLVKSSFNINNGNIIGYYVQNAAGNRIVFTNQAKPSNFDYEKFYTTGLSNTNRFNTALGSGAVGTTNGRIFGSFTTSKSWVIATSNSKSVTTDMIQYCLTYLKQAN